MAAIKYIKRTVALDGGPITEQLPASFFTGEYSAHTFIVSAIRGGQALTLSGTVTASFINRNDEMVPITACSIVDGAAVVTLANGCYHVNGRFTLTIYVNGAAIYDCESRIKLRSSTSAYDPTNVIPNLPEIQAEVAAMRAATTAAENMDIDMSTGTNQATITITRPDGTQKSQTIRAIVGDDYNALKDAIEDTTGIGVIQFSDPALRQYIVTNGTTVQWDTPSVSAYNNIKWAVVPCSPGDVFTINGSGGNADRLWAFANSSKTIISVSAASAAAEGLVLTAPENAAYLIINDETDSQSYIGDVGHVEKAIDDINKIVFPSENTYALDVGFENRYIETGDPPRRVYWNGADISNPIHLTAGQKIKTYGDTNSAIVAIACCYPNGDGPYSVIPSYDSDEQSAVAETDCYVVISYLKTSADKRYSITDTIKRDIYDLETRMDSVESLVGKETITIANSDKIGFFSNSYLNGYSMRTHHALDNLSMYSDYLFYNYGKSGDNALDEWIRINNNESWLGPVPVRDWGIRYGVIAMQDNDAGLFDADRETYYENFKKICEQIRAMGAIPILGTEHDRASNYYALSALAQEEGYMFMDWGKFAWRCGEFPPFWNSGHPETRTCWLWTNGMKPYIDTLPRPEKSIKIFRKRPDTSSDLADLVYNTNYDRAERFVEIYNGSKCLTKATEKYFDRLNNGLTAYEDVESQYQNLQAGEDTVAFSGFMLIECITPYTAKNISSLAMNLAATGVSHMYIKKNLGVTNGFSNDSVIAFGVTAGLNLLTVGSRFTVTGGVFSDTLLGEYTVSGTHENMVYTTTSARGMVTSGTDHPIVNVSGVTLSGSYKYPNADYINRFDKPIGQWVEVSFSDISDVDLSSYLPTCMDYDKIALLFTGSNMVLSDVGFVVTGTQKKNCKERKLVKKVKGVSLIADTLLDNNTAWENINSVPAYVPVVSAVDGSTTEPLPYGITTVRELEEGDVLTQSIDTTNLNKDPYHVDHIQIRVLARYFPKYINSDNAWNSTEIYEGSYDCAKLSVLIDSGCKAGHAHVGAFWGEYIFNVDYQAWGINTIRIKCDKKSLQIAKVEVDLVPNF